MISWKPSFFYLGFCLAKIFSLEMEDNERNYSGKFKPVANKKPEISKIMKMRLYLNMEDTKRHDMDR